MSDTTPAPCPDDLPVVGIPALDRQHLQMVTLVKALESELSQPDPNLSVVDATLRQVREYTRYHFGYEEGLMTATACPAADDNAGQHTLFLAQIALFERIIHTDNTTDAERFQVGLGMVRYLRGWISGHVCRVDCRLREFKHLIKGE